MHTSATICDAIRTRSVLSFDYEGFHRVVEPYCHGISKNGEALRAIQVGGESRSGKKGLGFGKLWIVAEIQNIQKNGQTFIPDDPQYNPHDKAMKHICCRI